MDPTRFDAFARALGDDARHAPTRRSLLAVLSGGLLAAVLTPSFAAEARRKNKRGNHGKGGKCKGKNKNKKKCAGGDDEGLGLRETCEPGSDTCKSGLECDSPTAFHQCSSTVVGIDAWCCVPPGGSCSRVKDECDCCGDYYCEYDDNNETFCVPIE